MREIALEEPGRFAERTAEPPRPGPGEALVRVHRVGVCGTDLHAFAGEQPFFSYPRVLGHELGVEVVEVADDVTRPAPGDRCAVEPYLHCGACVACRRDKPHCCRHLAVLGVHADGGMRPYFTVPAAKLHKSDRLALDELALVETLGIGAHAVERAEPARDETALVVGAGPIGLTAIAFLQARGLSPLVAERSAARRAFAERALGVERVLDPDEAPLTEQLAGLGDGEPPTLVMDATGHPASMAGAVDIAAHGGRVVFVGLFRGELSFHDPTFHAKELTLLATRNSSPATFDRVIAALENGDVDTRPWITRRLGFDEVVTRFGELPDDPELVKAVIDLPD